MGGSQVVVLVGPMGVGKTTVGKKLAKVLALPFIDTDAAVTQKHGPISEIFATAGEQTFRGYEREALVDALKHPAVVATGGGVILSEANRESLKQATVIYLSTDGKHIASRLKGGKRPLLQNGMEDWRRIYRERKPLYEEVADLTIQTSGQSLTATINEIRKALEA